LKINRPDGIRDSIVRFYGPEEFSSKLLS